MLPVRWRYLLVASLALVITFYTLNKYRPGLTIQDLTRPQDSVSPPPPPARPSSKIYKPADLLPPIQVVDNFPLAAEAHSAGDLPPHPSWNAPPTPHVKESTPLFIGFTRNWRLLQQTVVSYITAGWPAEDIYVVENTGTMESNARGYLSLQNPFFLNHTRLEMFRVNVIVTPTLLTFAQLQNFFIHTSTERGWPHYFWSHMDVVALSAESTIRFPSENETIIDEQSSEDEKWQTQSLYANCVAALRHVTSPDPLTGSDRKWSTIFFAYDHLALVSVAAYKSIGGWDTLIPFYFTDCDMHFRLRSSDLEIIDWKAGHIFDVAHSLDDLFVLYRQTSGPHGVLAPAPWTDPSATLPPTRKRKEPVSPEGLATPKEAANQQESAAPDAVEVVWERETEKDAWELVALFSSNAQDYADKHASLPIAHPNPELWAADTPVSETYKSLIEVLHSMQSAKANSEHGRNTWQSRAVGGKGEPFYRDSSGFETAIQMTVELGRNVYVEKWGQTDCDLGKHGLLVGDAWRVEHGWAD